MSLEREGDMAINCTQAAQFITMTTWQELTSDHSHIGEILMKALASQFQTGALEKVI